MDFDLRLSLQFLASRVSWEQKTPLGIPYPNMGHNCFFYMFLNKGSLHTRPFKYIHFSAFRWRTKNDFTILKSFRAFEKWASRLGHPPQTTRCVGGGKPKAKRQNFGKQDHKGKLYRSDSTMHAWGDHLLANSRSPSELWLWIISFFTTWNCQNCT